MFVPVDFEISSKKKRLRRKILRTWKNFKKAASLMESACEVGGFYTPVHACFVSRVIPTHTRGFFLPQHTTWVQMRGRSGCMADAENSRAFTSDSFWPTPSGVPEMGNRKEALLSFLCTRFELKGNGCHSRACKLRMIGRCRHSLGRARAMLRNFWQFRYALTKSVKFRKASSWIVMRRSVDMVRFSASPTRYIL